MPYKEAKQDEQSKSKQVQADSSRQLFAEKGCLILILIAQELLYYQPSRQDLETARDIKRGSKPIMPVGSTRQQKRKVKGHDKAQSINKPEGTIFEERKKKSNNSKVTGPNSKS